MGLAVRIPASVFLCATRTPKRPFAAPKVFSFTSLPWNDRRASTMTHSQPVKIEATGPDHISHPDHKKALLLQLEKISNDEKHIRIDGETPSNAEWALLGSHFRGVENLELESGFGEELNDKNIPLHWPLEKLEICDAHSELVRSPFVRQGLVPHLIFFFTSELRFEGPTSDELTAQYSAAIERGEKERQYLSPDSKLEMIFLPGLVREYMNKIYSNPDRELEPENQPSPDPIKLHTLEIYENDAMDALCRMHLAIPHVMDNVRTLHIQSTQGLDFHFFREDAFREVFPEFKNLKTLQYEVGDVFTDPSYLPSLYKILPPKIETLFFRGPASITKSEEWQKWVDAFASPEFLPQLKNLAFVLDLNYKTKESDPEQKMRVETPDDLLFYSRHACEALYEAARARGITVQEFPKPQRNTQLPSVDERW